MIFCLLPEKRRDDRQAANETWQNQRRIAKDYFSTLVIILKGPFGNYNLNGLFLPT